MTEEKKGLLIIFLIMTLGFSLIFSLYLWDRRDKFKVGDCVEQVYETEFYRDVYYHKVFKVGKEAYMTKQKKAGDDSFFDLNNFEWKFVLNDYEKVDSSLCDVAKKVTISKRKVYLSDSCQKCVINHLACLGTINGDVMGELDEELEKRLKKVIEIRKDMCSNNFEKCVSEYKCR